MEKIRIERTSRAKAKPTDETKLGFGNVFTDHMFLMNYDEGQGWHSPRIVPYGPILLDPAAMCLHYGQEVFEGLKAYRSDSGKALLFRPDKNVQRLNRSNERLCIPHIDEDFCLKAIKTFVDVENEWIPTAEGTSLYLRPFIFAVDPSIGVHPAKHLLFVIIASPSGAYYPEGINPVKIQVEADYVRAVKGGVGFAKTAANYAASLKAQDEAEQRNYTQVLWLDGIHRKYIEEVGTMNVFFKIDDVIVTPELSGSILPGVTRMSAIDLLKSWGIKVEERKLSIDEVAQAAREGKLEEAFGTGTAAVISPIGELHYNGDTITINNGEIGKISKKLYDNLTDIQFGRVEAPEGWVVEVKNEII